MLKKHQHVQGSDIHHIHTLAGKPTTNWVTFMTAHFLTQLGRKSMRHQWDGFSPNVPGLVVHGNLTEQPFSNTFDPHNDQKKNFPKKNAIRWIFGQVDSVVPKAMTPRSLYDFTPTFWLKLPKQMLRRFSLSRFPNTSSQGILQDFWEEGGYHDVFSSWPLAGNVEFSEILHLWGIQILLRNTCKPGIGVDLKK